MIFVNASAIPVYKALGDGVNSADADEVVEDEEEEGDGLGLVQVGDGLEEGTKGGKKRCQRQLFV